VYLAIYGLEKSGEGKLVLHPRLKPRCMTMIASKSLFSDPKVTSPNVYLFIYLFI
jgi:hypothetical protein